jgi:hypothetical protein
VTKVIVSAQAAEIEGVMIQEQVQVMASGLLAVLGVLVCPKSDALVWIY